MHSERGEETIERILHMMAGHDLNHLQQIERISRQNQKAVASTDLAFSRWHHFVGEGLAPPGVRRKQALAAPKLIA
jgi:hypothetical protein